MGVNKVAPTVQSPRKTQKYCGENLLKEFTEFWQLSGISAVLQDPKKYNRVRELLVANEEIKEAKKVCSISVSLCAE